MSPRCLPSAELSTEDVRWKGRNSFLSFCCSCFNVFESEMPACSSTSMNEAEQKCLGMPALVSKHIRIQGP